MTKSLTAQIVSLADRVNKKRREELINIMDNTSLLKALEQVRRSEIYRKGSKSKAMRKLASYPYEVDLFFEKIYGKDYYKDPDFFTKRHPEWLVVERGQL